MANGKYTDETATPQPLKDKCCCLGPSTTALYARSKMVALATVVPLTEEMVDIGRLMLHKCSTGSYVFNMRHLRACCRHVHCCVWRFARSGAMGELLDPAGVTGLWYV